MIESRGGWNICAVGEGTLSVGGTAFGVLGG